MANYSPRYTSSAEVITQVDFTTDDISASNLLNYYIKTAETWVDQVTGHSGGWDADASDITITKSGILEGHKTCILGEYPIVSTTSLTVDGTALTAGTDNDYVVDGDTGIITWRDSVPNLDYDNIVWLGKMGYAAVPQYIIDLATLDTKRRILRYIQRDDAKALVAIEQCDKDIDRLLKENRLKTFPMITREVHEFD